MLALSIIQILQILLGVARWIIIIQAVLSILISFNVINTSNDFVRQLHAGLDRVTEPLYRPIRRILPGGGGGGGRNSFGRGGGGGGMGGIDWAPFVVLIIIYILDAVILPNVAASLLTSSAA